MAYGWLSTFGWLRDLVRSRGSMEFWLSIAEQMDKAADELRLQHALNDRLSMILIDNAFELLLRRKLEFALLEYGELHKATSADRKRARSKVMNERVDVARSLGWISEDQALFILAAHRQRNKLYHENEGREPFVRALAFEYYELICSMAPKFEVGFQMLIGRDEMSVVARKYMDAMGNSKWGMIEPERLANELMNSLPNQPRERLSDQLADHAEVRRLEIANAMQFLISDNPGRLRAAELLRIAQEQHSLSKKLAKSGLDNSVWGSARHSDASKAAKAHAVEFVAKYRGVPHGAWSLAISRIRSEPSAVLAFVRYDRLMVRMSELGEAIGDLANSLDRWIQHEIDRARGK